MNVNKKLSFVILIAISLFIVCSMQSVFASSSYSSNEFTSTDSSADPFTQLSANKNVYSIDKNKIPKKYKQYENYTFQVAKGAKIKYKASINTAGDGIVYNLKGAKVKSAYIDFGKNNKKVKSAGWITQTYKKTGWYLIKVNMNGTCTGFANSLFQLSDINGVGKIINGTKYYLVYVANKPQLSLSKITAGYTSKANYKKGNIGFLDVKITNTGSLTSKATKIKIYYQDPKKFGKVYSKLKKYTATAKLKALKAGKSTTVRIFFKIPKSYNNLVKNIRLDYLNKVNQISRADNLYSFS